MHAAFRKYFWDGEGNISPDFALRRILEYAAFPDLLKLPQDMVRRIADLDPDRLRTSAKRIALLKALRPHLAEAVSFEDAVMRLLAQGFLRETLLAEGWRPGQTTNQANTRIT